ncbi:MAG: cell division protein FtsW [Rickettsiaceae bacterium]|nr:cell division protein FtsW [Rickettsiaceae bacterium]
MMKNNILRQWWRLIDQQSVIAYSILVGFSLLLVTTTSSTIAKKIGINDNYFSSRQVIYLLVGSIVVFALSFLDVKWIKRIGIIGFLFSILMLILTKFWGYEVKGATRWIRIGGFSYQPSEFIKPFFSVVVGWLLSLKYEDTFPGFTISLCLYIIVALLLITQPDIGMLVLITAIFSIQLFASGLPLIWIFISSIILGLGFFAAYYFLPHVAIRINDFIDPEKNENYQVTKSMLAFSEGGLYGKGPGEGSVKQSLPDAHTDFIFAVAGEELGAITCIVLIFTFAFITISSFIKIQDQKDPFVQFTAIGLISQFGLQSFINIGVTMNLLPTKGMTLPFVSYGGSSTIAISMAVGMLLALTKTSTSCYQYRIKT